VEEKREKEKAKNDAVLPEPEKEKASDK